MSGILHTLHKDGKVSGYFFHHGVFWASDGGCQHKLKKLSMDTNAGYIRAARIHLPSAVEKITFDRFHVAKQLGEVVDKTHQNELPHLPVKSWRQAKGTRFLWQYSDKWMTGSRQEKLVWLRVQLKLTSQCWALKEMAKGIWNRPWREERLNDWLWRL